jgi:gliding motility-associated-like protein
LQINQPGSYWIQTTNACGAYRDSIVISGRTFANVDLGAGRELCQYDTLHINNLLDDAGYNYTWSDNSTGRFMVVPASGKYWVDVRNVCGNSSDTIIITKRIDDCDCFLYMPTGFTPNGDGKNDLMKTFSNCGIRGELSIYNRWGQLVFITKDLQQGWNGFYNSRPQTSGVYIYQVRYSYVLRPGSFNKKGTFVLIR